MTIKIFISAVAVVIAFAGEAVADDETVISAERPGFSSSPIALPPSVFQIEGGYQYTRESGSVDVDDHTLPFALLRFGLAERLELQVSWAGYSRTDVGGTDTDGVNDAGVGVKWQITDDNATLPIALFAGVTVPVGDAEYSSDEVDPTIGAFWSYTAGLSWFGTLLVSESNNDASLSNAIGLSLPINANTGGYVEYYGIFTQGSGPEHYLNGGVAYLARNNLQLDVNAGLGLNSNAADLYLGMGIAYRF